MYTFEGILKNPNSPTLLIKTYNKAGKEMHVFNEEEEKITENLKETVVK